MAPAARLAAAEPDGRIGLGGDIDFGVLFPGEKGIARARVELEAAQPRRLFFDLAWNAPDWDELSSEAAVKPGGGLFELEFTVPESAAPGDYTGDLSISDGAGAGARAGARIRVGAVSFISPGAVDLGEIPPGTFVSRTIVVPFRADKEAALELASEGEDLRAETGTGLLPAGGGELALTATVSVPLDRKSGDYEGVVRLRGGPGEGELPLRWRVRPPAVKAEAVPAIPGLPRPPELPERVPGSQAPLPEAPPPLAGLDEPAGVRSGGPLDSPWDKAEQVLRENPDRGESRAVPVPDRARFPEVPPPAAKRDGGPWDAWWMYLLALLLLLLLFLLLLAYVLYRLGKSSLARFTLVSALSNAILAAIFLALLGASAAITPNIASSVTVNLIDEIPEAIPSLSAAEMGLLMAAGEDAAAKSAINAPAPAEPNLPADLSGSEGVSGLTRRLAAPEESMETLELSMAARPAAAPLEKRSEESLERRAGRDRRSETLPDEPLPELPRPPETGTAALDSERGEPVGDGEREVAESRPEIVPAGTADIPEWSDAPREALTPNLAAEPLAHGSTAVEKADLDVQARPIERRGRRREHGVLRDSTPEPRNDVPDPRRDQKLETPDAGNNASKNADAEVRENRPAVPMPAGRPTSAARPELIPAVVISPGDLPRSRPPGRAAAEQSSGRPAGRWREGSAASRREIDPGLSDSPPSGGEAGSLNSAADSDAVRKDADASRAAGRNKPSDAASEERRVTSLPAAGGVPEGAKPESADSRYRPGPGSPAPDADAVPRSGGSASSPNAGAAAERHDDGPSGDGGRDVDASPASPGQSAPGSGGKSDESLSPWPWKAAGSSWLRESGRTRRRTPAAASFVESDGILLVVGDLSRLPDSAVDNLFSALRRRLTAGTAIEERRLRPADANLRDCLLAAASPDAVKAWSAGELADISRYLSGGGHIWLDADSPENGEAAMRRLAEASGGSYETLPGSHPLAVDGPAGALKLGERLAAVSTRQNWRSGWRYREPGDDRALRFLVTALNYFLAGDSGAGIELGAEQPVAGLRVDSFDDSMPTRLAGEAVPPGAGAAWRGLFPASAWRLPGWSDSGRVTAGSDGKGSDALRLDLGGADKGMVSLYRPLNPHEDFSGERRLSVDVYYDGRGEASLSLLLTASQAGSWRDLESGETALSPGWNHLEFQLRGGRFRPLASGGGLVSADAPGLERVGRLGFLIRRAERSAAVMLLREARLHGE